MCHITPFLIADHQPTVKHYHFPRTSQRVQLVALKGAHMRHCSRVGEVLIEERIWEARASFTRTPYIHDRGKLLVHGSIILFVSSCIYHRSICPPPYFPARSHQ